MRLPSEPKPADFVRGSGLFRSLRSRLADAVGGQPAAPEAPQVDANGDAAGADRQPRHSGTVEVQPVLIRKTPKFPSRERHLAIRRKHRVPPPELQNLQSPPASPVSVTSARRLSK
uniref:Uncharacterized protein n=1 Tax=Anopheles atroparvus TaxID=41427 RepID=A0A182JFC2_ANOAO